MECSLFWNFWRKVNYSVTMSPNLFSNIRELLCILVVLSVGSAETERSFSCLRQIHSWLRTTMTDKRLGNLRELAIQRFDILLNVDKIYVYLYLHIWCMYIQWFIKSDNYYFSFCSMYSYLRRDSSLRLRVQVVDCTIKSTTNNRNW